MKKAKEPSEAVLLSQFPLCNDIEVRMVNNRIGWQKSIVHFNNINKKKCYECEEK